MLNLAPLADPTRPLRLLCIGAHSDDIEIGCAGTLLLWLQSPQPIHVTWVVLSATDERAREARRSAKALLRRAVEVNVVLGSFPDGHLPTHYAQAKEFLDSVKARGPTDVVFTHRLEDRHQDHRLISELTWNLWRDHLVLEYEIMKYEGDLGQPNVLIPLPAAIAKRKSAHLVQHFGTQRNKDWFSAENFEALARLRGLECRSASGFAEAFHARKLVLSGPTG